MQGEESNEREKAKIREKTVSMCSASHSCFLLQVFAESVRHLRKKDPDPILRNREQRRIFERRSGLLRDALDSPFTVYTLSHTKGEREVVERQRKGGPPAERGAW